MRNKSYAGYVQQTVSEHRAKERNATLRDVIRKLRLKEIYGYSMKNHTYVAFCQEIIDEVEGMIEETDP
jgi:hypothetical protein